MDNYRVGGTISKVECNKLDEILNQTFPDIKSRSRVFGCDFELENDDFELYINTFDEEEYSIQINYFKSEHELFQLLEKIKTMLIDNQLESELGYYLENEDGDQLSEDILFYKS